MAEPDLMDLDVVGRRDLHRGHRRPVERVPECRERCSRAERRRRARRVGQRGRVEPRSIVLVVRVAIPREPSLRAGVDARVLLVRIGPGTRDGGRDVLGADGSQNAVASDVVNVTVFANIAVLHSGVCPRVNESAVTGRGVADNCVRAIRNVLTDATETIKGIRGVAVGTRLIHADVVRPGVQESLRAATICTEIM